MTESGTGPGATSRSPSVGMWPSRRRRGRPILPQVIQLLATIVLLVLVYEAGFWVWERTEPREVSVPKVVGMREGDAMKLLVSTGLRAEVVARRYDEDTPEGAVVSAEPPPGRTVKEGRVVRLTLSTGSRWAVVPDVRDMSVDRARALLREARLGLGRERAEYDDKVPIGYVIGQAPEGNQKVPRVTAVDLWVSKGPHPEVQVVEDTRPAEGVRTGQIDLTVPPGPSLQEVRIVVRDRRGERTVYQSYREPGEKVTQTVSGEGPRIIIRVYLSGLLVQEHNI